MKCSLSYRISLPGSDKCFLGEYLSQTFMFMLHYVQEYCFNFVRFGIWLARMAECFAPLSTEISSKVIINGIM